MFDGWVSEEATLVPIQNSSKKSCGLYIAEQEISSHESFQRMCAKLSGFM